MTPIATTINPCALPAHEVWRSLSLGDRLKSMGIDIPEEEVSQLRDRKFDIDETCAIVSFWYEHRNRWHHPEQVLQMRLIRQRLGQSVRYFWPDFDKPGAENKHSDG